MRLALAVNGTQFYSKMQESEEFYKELYGQAPCMHYSVDERGIVLKSNTAGAQCLGYERGELIGKSLFDFLDEVNVVRFQAILDGVLKGNLSEDKLSLITKEGNTIHTIANATQVSLAGRQEIEIVLTNYNRKKKFWEKLDRAEKLVGLIAGIAHDFNNFLTIIRGNVHLVEEKAIGNKELKECLNIIKKATLDGAETVRRMKEFTNIRADTTKLVPLNLNHIVKEVLNYTRPRWTTLAQASGVTYNLKFAKATRGGWVMGNPSELKEVFLNVINNALDSMPKGGNLTIKIQRKGENLIVSVKDTGVGMPEEVQKRVFDPFFTTKGEKGSGLGMSVAYEIIAKHQGELKIKSKEGKGTIVLVKLPFNLARAQ